MDLQTGAKSCNVFTEEQAIKYFEELIGLHSLIRPLHILTAADDLTPGEHAIMLSLAVYEDGWINNRFASTNPLVEGACLAEVLFYHPSSLHVNKDYYIRSYFLNFLKNVSEDVGYASGHLVARPRLLSGTAVEFYRSAVQRFLELVTKWEMAGLTINEDLNEEMDLQIDSGVSFNSFS